MSDLPKTPNWDIPMDVHYGEIGNTEPHDAMNDDDIDEEEEEFIPDDVIEILGFNPEEETGEEDEEETPGNEPARPSR